MTADLSAEETYHIDYLAEIFDRFYWTDRHLAEKIDIAKWKEQRKKRKSVVI